MTELSTTQLIAMVFTLTTIAILLVLRDKHQGATTLWSGALARDGIVRLCHRCLQKVMFTPSGPRCVLHDGNGPVRLSALLIPVEHRAPCGALCRESRMSLALWSPLRAIARPDPYLEYRCAPTWPSGSCGGVAGKCSKCEELTT